MAFYKIRPKSGTAEQWERANTVLGEREIGYEYPPGGIGTGVVKMKMGDGKTAWNDLPYAQVVPLTVDDIVDVDSDAADKVPSAGYIKKKFGEFANKRGTFTPESSVTVLSSHNAIYKTGKIVYYKLQLQAKQEIKIGAKIAQLPSFAYPIEHVPIDIMILTGNVLKRVVANIRVTGEILVYDAIPVNSSFIISGTYVVN